MGCCHFYAPTDDGDQAFSVDVSAITFGPGCIAELGLQAARQGLRRVALFTDRWVKECPPYAAALDGLVRQGIEVAVFDAVHIEPTDVSFREATVFARELNPDGYVSLGGGSVIDTCKAANLYASHPAAFQTYVNAPVGDGVPVPGPLKPHIACPTTSGTGSECTGIAVFDWLELKAKTGIASRRLRPDLALIDPEWTNTLPAEVVAASGFDVLSHALESLTARPYCRRPFTAGGERPLSQGANPWSDMGASEALRLLGRYLERAVGDADDREARGQVMWAATLAGIAFGNAGVHLPHGMSYAVAGQVRDYHPPGYPVAEPMVPHGTSVIVNAPAVFRATAKTSPERHLEAAVWLGADARDAIAEDSGEVLGVRLIELMKTCAMPNGLAGVGYGDGDVGSLTDGAIIQRRLLDNAPVTVDEALLGGLFGDALSYW